MVQNWRLCLTCPGIFSAWAQWLPSRSLSSSWCRCWPETSLCGLAGGLMAPESNIERPDPPECHSSVGLCRSISGPSLATSRRGSGAWNTSDHSWSSPRWEASKMRAPVESWVRLGSWDLTVAGSWGRWVGQAGSAALSSLVSSCAHSH